MSRLSWGLIGERRFEIGIDRGVLYIDDAPGVPWNGLISVDESPSGGESKPYYQDGIKYANRASAEEFEATITAFSSPVEFDSVDGSLELYDGFVATAQRRKSFGLAYRSKIGNDVNSEDKGYKIHLIYNALAAPTQSSRTTINDSVNPIEFSWAITTVPVVGTGFRPTAHFIIDSTDTDPDMLSAIEDILYGSDTSEPRLPTISELITIYDTFVHPPVTYSTIISLARQSVEALIKGFSSARVGRHSIETVISGASSARLAQHSIQTVISGDSKARTARQSVEVVITN